MHKRIMPVGMWRGRHESGFIAQQRGGEGHWPVGGRWLTKVVHTARGEEGDWMYWEKG